MNVGERLAFFLPSLREGGAERVVLTLASGFADHGLEVDLVLAKAEGPFLEDVQGNVRLVDLDKQRVIRSLPGLVAYLKRVRPKAILSAMEHANLVAIWAKKLARVDTRIIASVHETVSKAAGGNLLKRMILHQLLRYSYVYADRIVAVSKGVADDYIAMMQLSNAQVRVIYNPALRPEVLNKANEAPTHPWFTKKTTPVVLSVGRLTLAKDYPVLMRAMKAVWAETGARLVVFGEGEERRSLEAQIKREELDEIVSLPGFTRNPYAHIRRADVFVLSSRWEGFGMVLAETMALGTPVVSTDCPNGPAEILENGRWGWLVPVGDERALAEAIIETLKNPQRDFAVKRSTDFSSDKILHEYAEVLDVSR